MNKIYNKKPNILIYILLLAVIVIVQIWAIEVMNYYSIVVILGALFLLMKIIKIKINPEEPVIKLTDTEIHLLTADKKIKYSEISDIRLNSKLSNGSLTLKETKKKVIIDSAEISRDDQKEILDFILNKIKE